MPIHAAGRNVLIWLDDLSLTRQTGRSCGIAVDPAAPSDRTGTGQRGAQPPAAASSARRMVASGVLMKPRLRTAGVRVDHLGVSGHDTHDDQRRSQPISAYQHQPNPPGEENWHCATNSTFMCHLAMLEGVPGSDGTTWLEPVTDEQYQAANKQ